jgi:hypothetical protein
VRVSLRTFRSRRGQIRNAEAGIYVENVFRALRQDAPVALTHKQATVVIGSRSSTSDHVGLGTSLQSDSYCEVQMSPDLESWYTLMKKHGWLAETARLPEVRKAPTEIALSYRRL